MSGLVGRTVVVTRSREQAASLCAALRERGATPVAFPTITARPVPDPWPVDAAIAGLGAYDWTVFTSANGVRFFCDRLEAAHRAFPPALRVAAVGSATAESLAGRGLPVHAMPGEFRGARLAAAMGDLSGRRVLLARADLGREETAEALRAAGAKVHDLTVYLTVPAGPDPEGRRAVEAGVDAVTFTSPSTVRNFLALTGDGALRLLEGAVVACIGPTTAEAARALGLAVQVQPATYTVNALVEALDAYFSTMSPVAPGGVP